jgi:hypothetical protein
MIWQPQNKPDRTELLSPFSFSPKKVLPDSKSYQLHSSEPWPISPFYCIR